MLTPTIPGREAMLTECRASVLFQTMPRWEHLYMTDEEHRGCATTMNELAEQAQGDWVLPLADDDLLLPGCLEVLLAHSENADVVYAPPLVWGMPPEPYQQAPPVIPSFALIALKLWRQLGGYDAEWNREEDRRLWIRALAAGARFVRADSAPTWVYRFHGGNKSLHDGIAA